MFTITDESSPSSDAARAFAAATLPWLLRDPLRNTVPAAFLQGLLDGTTQPPPRLRLLRADRDGEVCGVAYQTPPRALYLASGDLEAATALGAHMREAPGDAVSVDGLTDDTNAFLTACSPTAGRALTRTRLHVLGTLTPPRAVPGGLAEATAADRDLLVAWIREFGTETGAVGWDAEAAVDARLTRPGLCWFWRVEGEPVSFLWLTRPVGGVVRLSAVCTPRPLRGRGYASACVAAASAEALHCGAERCVLYTDLENPISNRIYARVGYVPLADGGVRSLNPDDAFEARG